MTISKHPEDSILKRHFDATVEMKRQMWLQIPPTDSILHRHAMSMSNHPAMRPGTKASGVTSTSSVDRSAAAPRERKQEKSGFLSWLTGLFRSA